MVFLLLPHGWNRAYFWRKLLRSLQQWEPLFGNSVLPFIDTGPVHGAPAISASGVPSRRKFTGENTWLFIDLFFKKLLWPTSEAQGVRWLLNNTNTKLVSGLGGYEAWEEKQSRNRELETWQ